MPPEETSGLVAASDDKVVDYVHHSLLPPLVTGHRDHKRKRRKHDAKDALLPQELTATWSTIDADRGGTELATPTGGAHRSQRRAPAAERTGAGGSSSKDDKASPFVALPASSKAIRVKHSSSSSSFVIGGDSGGKQHSVAGSGSSPGDSNHSYYANNHAAATPSSSSRRLTILGPAAPPPPHLPAKARRPPSPSAANSAVVPLKSDDHDERFRRGVEVFGEWDVANQQAAVNHFVTQQSPPKGDDLSFWLTPTEATEDLEYVHKMVEQARRKVEARKKTACGSEKPRRH